VQILLCYFRYAVRFHEKIVPEILFQNAGSFHADFFLKFADCCSVGESDFSQISPQKYLAKLSYVRVIAARGCTFPE